MKVDIAGVQIDNLTKTEAIAKIDEFVGSGKPHYVVTPYSEIVVFAQRDENYKQVLNHANLALPDGIGILWAAKYLSLTTNHFPLITSLAAIVFNPKHIRSVVHEQVTGSRLIYDIAKRHRGQSRSFREAKRLSALFAHPLMEIPAF